jgi:hypothetical protein
MAKMAAERGNGSLPHAPSRSLGSEGPPSKLGPSVRSARRVTLHLQYRAHIMLGRHSTMYTLPYVVQLFDSKILSVHVAP